MKFNIFNKKKNSKKNHQGAKAFKMTPKMELYTSVVTSSLSNTFYEKEKDRLNRIIKLMKIVDPTFVAKLAVYTREQMYLRSIPLVLATELSKIHKGDSLVKKTVSRVIGRADEITEMLAYYQVANNRTGEKKLNRLSKQVQKGVATAFNKFDEYQFAKYNRKTAVSLKDALFLTHPKAKDESQQDLFNKIANDTLSVPYTWEVELSGVGQQAFRNERAKQKAIRLKWQELIDSGRLGYMAMMRNLRNMLQADISNKHLQIVGDRLSDPHQVRKSRQLPFRFLSAYRELEALKDSRAGYLLECLEEAVKTSVENIKGFDLNTKILLASDVSGSMYAPISPRSKVQCYDIGLLLSMLMRNKSSNVITGIFGDTWEATTLPKSSILANTQKLRNMAGRVGYSTNAYKVLQFLNKKKVKMDKVMFFTDLQMWDSTGKNNSLSKEWARYKENVAPNAKLYLFDLVGYGQSPLSLKENDVYLIAGWSDKVFEVMQAIEDGEAALKMIEKIKL